MEFAGLKWIGFHIIILIWWREFPEILKGEVCDIVATNADCVKGMKQ